MIYIGSFFVYYRIPLPDATNGKHQPNELDKLLRKTRIKYMKLIVSKCDKLPNMEFKSVLEELEEIYDILDQLQKEVPTRELIKLKKNGTC